MKQRYSYNSENGNTAKALLREEELSAKHAIEICSVLRNKKVEYAKKYLESVKKQKQAVKFTRFVEGAGHKTAIGPGKYPLKAANVILKAVKSAETNAVSKGLGKDLKIIHISAQRASAPWHYGRHSRRKMKRTHIEIIVEESVSKQKSAKKEVQENKQPKEISKQEKPVTKPVENQMPDKSESEIKSENTKSKVAKSEEIVTEVKQ